MERKKLGRFPEGVLEHISKTIGDWSTGSEIAELLRVAGYPHKSQLAGTKWRYLYAIFKEFQDKPDGQYHVAKIVQIFCDPTRWIRRLSEHKQVMNIMNEGLAYVNLQLNESAKLVISEERITHVSKEEVREAPTRFEPMMVTPVFVARDTRLQEDLCFVLMPFRPSFDRLYKEKMKPTVEACGFKCLRSDDLFSPTPILEDIWIHICRSKIIVADVTGRNPNVFYEIGIAHTVGKPVIIITQDRADIPFA